MTSTGASADTLEQIQVQLRDFAIERDWEQFHTPKNLAMALTAEAGELVEIFQWLTPNQSLSVMDSPNDAEKVREEVADVAIYLLRLADVLGLELADAILAKMRKNALKYPVDLSRGHATKYDRLGEPT